MSRGAKDAKLSNEIEVSGAQNDKTRVKAVSDLTAEEILNEPKELRVIRRAKRTTKDAESVKSSAVKSAFTNCQRRPRNRHRKSKLGEPKKGFLTFINMQMFYLNIMLQIKYNFIDNNTAYKFNFNILKSFQILFQYLKWKK